MKKFWKDWKKTTLALFGILVAAFLLRVLNLTHMPVFADEAIYVRWAQVMRAEPTLRFLPLSDGKQPLFMWSMIPFFKVFVDPLFAGRFVSALTGVGTAIGLFFAGYLLFDSKKVGLLSCLIYSISPFSVFFDRLALVDSMLTMFGVFTFLGSVLIVKTKRLDVAMLSGFALGGAFLTKSPSLFFAMLLPAGLILTKIPKKRNDRLKLIGQVLGLWSVTFLIAYGMYNIMRLGPNFHLLSLRNKDYVYPLSHILESPLDPFKPFLHRIYEYFIIMGPSVLIFLSALGLIFNFKERKREVLVIAAWGLLPILVNAEFAKNMTARYIYFAVPYFFILAASSLLVKKEFFKKMFIGGILLFTIHAFYIDYYFLTDLEAAPLPRSERSGYLEEWTAGTGIKEIAEYIVEVHKSNPEKQIVVGTEGYFGTLPDGLQLYLNPYRDITVKGIGLELDHLSDDLLNAKRAGNEVYLVVNNTRFGMNAQKVGLEIVAVYPKAVKPDGSREALLLLRFTEKTISGPNSS